jgi:hypothetical protein
MDDLAFLFAGCSQHRSNIQAYRAIADTASTARAANLANVIKPITVFMHQTLAGSLLL